MSTESEQVDETPDDERPANTEQPDDWPPDESDDEQPAPDTPDDEQPAPDTPDDEQPDGVGEPSYAPPYLAGGIAIGGALLVIATIGVASFTAALVAALGTWTVGGGLARGDERIATGGAALLFGSILVAGLEGTPELFLLAAAVGTAVAFDASRYAVRLGHQVGREAPTTSAEIAHVAVVATTTTVTAGVGYLVFLVGSGEQTTTTLVALLLATLLLISGLYVRES